MPAILTHYTFAFKNSRDLGEPNRKALLLGAQGPDPFFFYGYGFPVIRKNAHDVREFGSKLHKTDISPIYMEMIKIARKEEDLETRNLLFAYIEGLFLHYVLDRNCHPYIFARGGCAIKGKEDRVPWSSYHARFESILDYLIGKRYGTYTRHTDICISLEDEKLKKISDLWNETNKITLRAPAIDKDSFMKSVKDFRRVVNFTNNPTQLSKIKLTLLTGPNSLPSSLRLPNKLDEKYASLDFCNQLRTPWYNCVTGEQFILTWDDLVAKAVSDYENLIPLLDKAMKNGEDVSIELKEFSHNINHDGDLIGGEKIYRDPIWPELADLAVLPK